MPFHELPDGSVVNERHIVRLKDVTGGGHLRVHMSDGFTKDLDETESARLKAALLYRQEVAEVGAIATYIQQQQAAQEAAPKRKPGRPKKTQPTTT